MFGKLRTVRNNRLYKPAHANRVLFDGLRIVGRTPTTEQALKNVIEWIKASFDATPDGGSSAYYRFGSGWKASYPETTGYLIPTLYEHAVFSADDGWRKLATGAADWLLSIQAAEGGWQGLQVDQKAELRVFNTGMILDGLVAAYRVEQDARYLDAAIKGMKWTFDTMDENGFFSRFNVVGGGAFDTLVVACLLMVVQCMAKEEQEKYRALAKRALDAHLSLQTENGWFRKCNFTGNDTALLHHLGYTLDGLLISSEILGDDTYYDAARRTAQRLLSKFEVNVELPAYTKADWTTHNDLGSRPSQCLTGYSQIAIVFQKIHARENDLRYLNAALKINDIVASIGNYRSSNAGIHYGISGSYPVNGNYQPFQMVNWAAKYHAESLLLSLGACMPKKLSP